MPNWCNNNISIVGPKDTIKQLWDDAHAQEDGFGLLNAMYPMPKELEGTTAPSESGDDWYNWRVNNWSTKWDISDEGLEYREDGDTGIIEGWFDSAWSPPIGVYEKFCDDFDNCDLEASYNEPGMDFAGFWSKSGGDEFLDGCSQEYELPEDERSELYKRLDDEYGLSEQFAEWNEMEADDA